MVGSGGREHALALALSRSAMVTVTPGNAGMPGPGIEVTPVPPEELEADLYVIGPETPLVDGLADRLRARGCRVVGPGADGAMLEGSKTWMKRLLVEAGVPTAEHRSFTALDEARAYLRATPGPWAIKADGLAGGKGVLVTGSRKEAEADAEAKLSGRAFGLAGRTLVVEQALCGPELTVLALCDGTRAVPLAPAQDFKRVGDGDTGPNTGGMGAYSPVPVAGPAVMGEIVDRILEPTVAALCRQGIEYRGVLYAQLMLTDAGPFVIEYNVRFGDPETQAVLPRLDQEGGDLAELLVQVSEGRLREGPRFVADRCVTIVLAAPGYPERPETGGKIEGVEAALALPSVTVYGAGVERDGDAGLVTAGGRVLDVTATGATLALARQRAYAAAAAVSWPGIRYRGDIASEAASLEAAMAGDATGAAPGP
ncbi:MAG: phosphoribosylamine--glycine ligase [Acidimicrobiales bacterium]|nr:phosphoribosylamine--glycine ligase [Acidimicrobiales bacterium]